MVFREEVHERAHAQGHEAQLRIEQVVGPRPASERLEDLDQPALAQMLLDDEPVGLEDARAVPGQRHPREDVVHRPGAAEWAQVKSAIAPADDVRIPTLAAMARDFDLLYSRFALPPASAPASDADAIVPLVAANLEGFAFRRELVNLADELGRAKDALAEAKPWVAKLESDIAATRAWAQKLEHDVDVLNASVAELVDEKRRLIDIRDAFELLPSLVRRILLKWAFRARR